ncbi:MAG: hypothetical protein J6O55_05595 [Lachnospiraceae bacterium]|nr:hypothetical protein [Lachnospiraceae bacterium]
MGIQNNLILSGFASDPLILPTAEVVCNISYFASGVIKGAAILGIAFLPSAACDFAIVRDGIVRGYIQRGAAVPDKGSIFIKSKLTIHRN